MPVCEECKGDGYKDGFICTACKGKGTVEALAQSRRIGRSFNDKVQCDIYDRDPALSFVMSTTPIFTRVLPVAPYQAELKWTLRSSYLTKDQSLGLSLRLTALYMY